MKIPFRFRGVHHCSAVVFTCMDFRFRKELGQFIEDRNEGLGIEPFDDPKLPGAAKNINELDGDLDLATKSIGISCDLHEAKTIVIVNHEDCGAYGGSAKFGNDPESEQKFHEEELKKAREKIAAKFPGKEIILVYAKLVDNKEYIEFITVN